MCLLESGFTSWALEVIQKEYTGSPVYDKEAEVDHRCLTTSNVMCLAMTAKCETFRTLLSEDSLVPQTLWSQGAYRLEIISALQPKGLGDETSLKIGGG